MVILPGRRAGFLGNDGYTKLLLHFDGADEAVETTDSSSSGKTITFGGTAQLDTATKKFGTASLLCAAGGSAFISLADSADWDFGTGGFTIDTWYYLAALPGNDEINYLYHRTPADPTHNYTRIDYRELDAKYYLRFLQVESDVTTISLDCEATLSTSAWNHIALVRSGNVFTLYVNGASVGNATDASSIADWMAGISIGESTVAAQFDEYRISNVARWTGAFNPYQTPYR